MLAISRSPLLAGNPYQKAKNNLKQKVNYFILQNQDIPVIAKLKGNIPLTPDDSKSLENLLWSELGTKEQYEAQFKNTPLGELVRSIVGLSLQAANEAFSAFISYTGLDSSQMHFVKQIVNYIVRNGMMKDLTVLQESPFSDMGSFSEVFANINAPHPIAPANSPAISIFSKRITLSSDLPKLKKLMLPYQTMF